MKDKLKQLKNMYHNTGYNMEFIFLSIIIIFETIIEVVAIPNVIKRILNVEIPNENIKGLIFFCIVNIGILVLSCYIVLKQCNIRCILKRKVERDLKEKVFAKMQKIKTKFYDDNDFGVVLQFLQTDTIYAGELFPQNIVEMYLMGFINFSIIAIFLMFIDLRTTLLILCIYGIGFLITIYFNRKSISIINEIRKINIEIYSAINEGIQGFLTIKILNIINKKEKELEDKLEQYTKINSKLEKVIAEYNNIFKFITSFSTAIIVYFAGIDVVKGIATYAEIVLLIEYTGSLKYYFNWFLKHLTDFDKSFFSYSKILQFLNSDNIEEIEKGEKLEDINNIEFKNVYFSYNGNQKNIKNYCLKIDKNEKVALVGKTGSGKTTVTSLLCRFYEPIKGKILINGKDYKNYSIESLRNRIGYVMQETQIMPNSIIDNIKYVNKDITIKEIEEIFKKLKLHDKIMKLENGYYADIYNNPDVLSTGEKQMINFARIMAVNVDVVMLDEVTSALSYESEMLVKNAIKEVTKNKIAIIVAHRLSTIKDCDKIVIMKEGKIIEQGTHNELIERKSEYYNLVNI